VGQTGARPPPGVRDGTSVRSRAVLTKSLLCTLRAESGSEVQADRSVELTTTADAQT